MDHVNKLQAILPSTKSTPSVFGGAMIIAGTAIGAGMLALPITTAGMWYLWTIPVIFLVWLCMYISGLFIIEANLHYPIGAHLGSIAKDCLPPSINIINSLSLLFVLYVLTYAYITIGSPFFSDAVKALNYAIPNKLTAMIYVVVFGGFVVCSTKIVDRVTSVILVSMIITFAISFPSLVKGVTLPNLLNYVQSSPQYTPYIYSGLASMVAAFGFHGNVSSLVQYYQKDHKKVKHALWYGTLITAAIYYLWITGAQGSLSRAFFQSVIIPAESPALELIKQLNVSAYLTFFSNLAILSSFLGVALGLFDFIADSLKFNNTIAGRVKTGVVTFTPPLILAIMYPYGFILAIGFAGLLATIWAIMVPALMVIATRKKYTTRTYQVKGGNFTPYSVIFFGALIAVCEVLSIAGVLPSYQ